MKARSWQSWLHFEPVEELIEPTELLPEPIEELPVELWEELPMEPIEERSDVCEKWEPVTESMWTVGVWNLANLPRVEWSVIRPATGGKSEVTARITWWDCKFKYMSGLGSKIGEKYQVNVHFFVVWLGSKGFLVDERLTSICSSNKGARALIDTPWLSETGAASTVTCERKHTTSAIAGIASIWKFFVSESVVTWWRSQMP